ncbi:MAG: DUF542 domain-containing protein [Nitrospinae bacterium]|nr:DUF542 domain-containing protein [Nitrospinota bacterium]
MNEINKDMMINEVIKLYPATVRVFKKYEVDSCCGGAQGLDVAAQLYGIDLEKMMEDLNEVIQEGEK